MKKPTLGITLGDGAGIGPEVVLKTLRVFPWSRICRPIVIGDAFLLDYWTRRLRLPLYKQCEFVDCGVLRRGERIVPGRISARMGEAAMRFVRRGVEMALRGEIDALVTAPLQKEAVHRAGYDFPGHTEYLAKLCGAKKVSMMFAGGGLKIVLVTIHVPLREVSKLLTRENILRTIEHAHLAGRLFGARRPHIAVAGLNPHAGEGGILGKEERRVIAPAIATARRRGWHVTGPYPPDTLFYRARREKIDVVVVMYHDQGLIPLKMLAFDESVNITLGLPFIRTSPDHGTAYDIAGKGIANPSSLWHAVQLATQLSSRRPGRR